MYLYKPRVIDLLGKTKMKKKKTTKTCTPQKLKIKINQTNKQEMEHYLSGYRLSLSDVVSITLSVAVTDQ